MCNGEPIGSATVTFPHFTKDRIGYTDLRRVPARFPQRQPRRSLHRPGGDQPGALFSSYATGKLNAYERLEAPGGIAYCGNDQQRVRVCPKGIPLTEANAEMNRPVAAKA